MVIVHADLSLGTWIVFIAAVATNRLLDMKHSRQVDSQPKSKHSIDEVVFVPRTTIDTIFSGKI